LTDIQALGYKLVIFPVSLLFGVTRSLLTILDTLKQGEIPTTLADDTVTFAQFTNLVGLPAIQELERRYSVNG
jgi:2-methylisocitrate lyase-like PEP mutase family enzyme